MARPKELHLIDLPTISAREAGAIFGWTGPKFKKKFKEIHWETIHVEQMTNRGFRYSLTDCIATAYPEADNFTVHALAARVMKDRMMEIWAKKEENLEEE